MELQKAKKVAKERASKNKLDYCVWYDDELHEFHVSPLERLENFHFPNCIVDPEDVVFTAYGDGTVVEGLL